MSSRRKNIPPANVDPLTKRFSMGGVEPQPAPEPSRRESGRKEPSGMVRKTYYYSAEAAKVLEDAIDRIHYDSRGAVPKHVALAAIVQAGVERVDEIARRLIDSHQ